MKVCAFFLLALVGVTVAVPFDSWLQNAKNALNGFSSKAGGLKQKIADIIDSGSARHQAAMDAVKSTLSNVGGAVKSNYGSLVKRGGDDMAKLRDVVVNLAPENFKEQVEEYADSFIDQYQQIAAQGQERVESMNEKMSSLLNTYDNRVNAIEGNLAEELKKLGEDMLKAVEQPQAENTA